LIRQCAGKKRDGSPCTATVEPPNAYCWWHDPKHADVRRRAASRGGKSKATREVRRLIADLETLKADVLAGSVDRLDAAVVVQATRAQTALIEQERKLREQAEVLVRIEALELTVRRQGGIKAWG
jgi:hypothetical protein